MRKISYITKTLFILSLILFARDAAALTLSPPLKEIGADPGSKVQGIIKIYNESREEITVSSSVADFSAKTEGSGEPEFVDVKNNESVSDLASWIEIPNASFSIKPLDWQSIIFEISVPKDAEPGGHYAAIFFTPVNSQKEKGNVSVDYKTGSLILLTVSGDAKQEGRLESFKIKNDLNFFDYIPVNFEIRIKNNGNVHFRPGGGVEIRNIFGKKTADMPILKEESGGNVLPGSIRKYEVIWGGSDLPQGFWNIVKYEWNNFHVGPYKAIATIGLPQGLSEPMNVSFWIFPWQLLIVVLVAFIIICFIFRTYNHWIIKKARGK
jgi:hypothetical protein